MNCIGCDSFGGLACCLFALAAATCCAAETCAGLADMIVRLHNN